MKQIVRFQWIQRVHSNRFHNDKKWSNKFWRCQLKLKNIIIFGFVIFQLYYKNPRIKEIIVAKQPIVRTQNHTNKQTDDVVTTLTFALNRIKLYLGYYHPRFNVGFRPTPSSPSPWVIPTLSRNPCRGWRRHAPLPWRHAKCTLLHREEITEQ